MKPSYDVEAIRRDFPALAQQVNGKPLIYLDNAASTQKAQPVLDALAGCYERDYSNIHRGVHQLSVRATTAYEQARESVQRFIGAPRTEEIVFVRGTTEGINLVAQSWGRASLEPGDEVRSRRWSITRISSHGSSSVRRPVLESWWWMSMSAVSLIWLTSRVN